MNELLKRVDLTNLRATATSADIKELCENAKKYGCATVCVNSCYVGYASWLLAKSKVGVCTVVGFPLGAMAGDSKMFEAINAKECGATEIDMVINVGLLKSGEMDYLAEEISLLAAACHDKEDGNKRAKLKVIIETCYLTDEEKVAVSRIAVENGADYVKTSTGFGTGGATVADIELIRKTIGTKGKIKASGGIRDKKTAEALVKAGADRLGMSDVSCLLG